MAFWREKTIKGRQYQYLIETYRDSGKVRHHTLAGGKFSPEQQLIVKRLYDTWLAGDVYPGSRALCVELYLEKHPEAEAEMFAARPEYSRVSIWGPDYDLLAVACEDLSKRGMLKQVYPTESEGLCFPAFILKSRHYVGSV